MVRPLRVVTLVLLVALAAPTAQASAARLHLVTMEPVALDGKIAVQGPGATARGLMSDPNASVRGATGSVLVQTWHEARGLVGRDGGSQAVGKADAQTFVVRDATLSIASTERAALVTLVLAPDATAVAVAQVREDAKPTWLAARVAPTGTGAVPAYRTVPWEWPQGWAFAGDFRPGVPLTAAPSPGATLSAIGRVALEIDGGTVRFVDDQGASRTFDLGPHDETPSAPVPGVEAGETVFRSLIFEGSIADARLPLSAPWGIAAPELAWDFAGDARWTGARGELTQDGSTRSFDGATVVGHGAAKVVLGPEGVAAVDYAADGDWDSLTVDGSSAIRASSGAPPAVVGVAAAGAAVLILAAWIAYTRIDRARLLDHPTRFAIMTLVGATPGTHLREIHRAVGGAWGPFAFHVGMLTQGGLLRLERHGRYAAAFPSAAPRGAPRVHHPLARRIRDALPPDGSAVPASHLQEVLGVSRQLLSYHLAKLQTEGVVTRGPDGLKLVVAPVEAKRAPSD